MGKLLSGVAYKRAIYSQICRLVEFIQVPVHLHLWRYTVRAYYKLYNQLSLPYGSIAFQFLK